MAELLLVNPARRKRRKSRRKMTAKQLKYFGGGRKRRSRTRARVTTKRRRRRSVVAVNPRRRRRSRRALTVGFRRRRRNPSMRASLGSIQNSVVPLLKAGGMGAAGAIGLDLLWGYGKGMLPATIAGSPIAQYGAKLLGAILVGIAGDMVFKGKGKELATGAATVVLHDAMKAQLQTSFPTLQLGEYLTYAPTVGSARQAGRLLSTGMGEYLNGLPQAVGYSEDSSGFYGDGDGGFTGDGMSGY